MRRRAARAPAHRRAPQRPPEHRHRNGQQPGNQPMVELHGRHVVEEILPPRVEHQDFGRHHVAVHQRKRVVGEARADAGDEPARQHHDEHQPARDRPPRTTAVPAAPPRAAGTTATAPPRTSRRRSANARPRCAVSRNCDTRGSSTSPLCTMYQPSAPCRPPSTKMRGQRSGVAARNLPRAAGTTGTAEERDADQRGRAAGGSIPTRRCP